jgi:putative polyketide hydroxylase
MTTLQSPDETVDVLVIGGSLVGLSTAMFLGVHGIHDAPLHEHPSASHGRPGSRAPHLPLERAGEAVSTLDLFGTAFVLLTGADGETWRDAACRAADARDVPLDAYLVGGGELRDPSGAFAAAYGISLAGAVLVRPDGFVAWRVHDATGASDAIVGEVLDALLLRQGDARSEAAASTTGP